MARSQSTIDEEIGYVSGDRIRYEVMLPVWEKGEVLPGVTDEAMPPKAPMMRVMVSLSPTYPMSAAPQLQLLGRYLGNFSIDADLCESSTCPRAQEVYWLTCSRGNYSYIYQLVRGPIYAGGRLRIRGTHACPSPSQRVVR